MAKKPVAKPSGGTLKPELNEEVKEAPKAAAKKFDAEEADASLRRQLSKMAKRLDNLEQVNDARLRSRGLID